MGNKIVKKCVKEENFDNLNAENDIKKLLNDFLNTKAQLQNCYKSIEVLNSKTLKLEVAERENLNHLKYLNDKAYGKEKKQITQRLFTINSQCYSLIKNLYVENCHLQKLVLNYLKTPKLPICIIYKDISQIDKTNDLDVINTNNFASEVKQAEKDECASASSLLSIQNCDSRLENSICQRASIDSNDEILMQSLTNCFNVNLQAKEFEFQNLIFLSLVDRLNSNLPLLSIDQDESLEICDTNNFITEKISKNYYEKNFHLSAKKSNFKFNDSTESMESNEVYVVDNCCMTELYADIGVGDNSVFTIDQGCQPNVCMIKKLPTIKRRFKATNNNINKSTDKLKLLSSDTKAHLKNITSLSNNINKKGAASKLKFNNSKLNNRDQMKSNSKTSIKTYTKDVKKITHNIFSSKSNDKKKQDFLPKANASIAALDNIPNNGPEKQLKTLKRIKSKIIKQKKTKSKDEDYVENDNIPLWTPQMREYEIFLQYQVPKNNHNLKKVELFRSSVQMTFRSNR